VNCTQCGCENPAGHRFCGNCGAALRVPCASCGFANPAGQRFCGGCGRALEDAAVGGPAAAAAAPLAGAAGAPHEGRRQATILFTDLTGFTELASRLDAEDLHAIVQAFFDRVEGVVRNLGGSVERYVGDAIMAVFGARIAHDDDALRAVRAGLDIQAAMPELGARYARALHSVVGLATGEVVVMMPRPGYAAEVAIVGASVNLAARIESLGAPGDVLASADVYRQVARRVRASPLGAQRLKGIDHPVEVWRIEELVADHDATRQMHFVGRASELEMFGALLAQCAARHSSATLLLRGEPGIGKTRLLGAMVEAARARGCAVHAGGFLDFGFRRGTEGLHGAARSLLGIDPGADALGRRACADAAVARGEVPADALPALYELCSAAPTDESRRQLDAMNRERREQKLREAAAALVAAAARQAPLLLVMEDVHWADARDLERLADLAARCGDLPVLFALASRVVEDPVSPAWQVRGIGGALTCLELAPLGADEMRSLAADFQGVGRSVVDGCIERSGGNPLFLEQLLRHAVESGQTSLPASVRSLVLARMDLLAEGDNAALQAAAVLGQRFELDALRAVIGRADFVCDGLVRAHLLKPVGHEFLFAHALIHEAAYASLLRRNARELHLRAAAWYATRDPALHARHLDRAESPQAARAYLGSAIADTEAGRHDRARVEIARGLEIAADAADREALMLQQGQLLHDIGEVHESIEVYRSVLESAGSDAQRARALIGLAAGMRLSDDIEGALGALAEAEPIARGMDAELARIHYLRGSLCFPRGDIDGCRREHGHALEHARRAGLPRAEADALSGLGDAAYASGRMRTAYESFRACMTLCARHGFGRIEAANRFMVATVRIYLNEFEGALVDALESAELARKVGHQRAEIVSRLTAGWILHTLGRIAEARREATTGLEVAEALGAGRFRPFLLETVARVDLAAGDAAAARRTIAEALQLAREGRLLRFIGPWLLSTFALCADDPAARRAALDEGAALLADGCVGHNYYNFYAHAIDASADLADGDAVARWADALERYTRAEPNPWADFHVARGRALAAWIGGADDAGALGAVRSQAEAFGFRSTLARLDAAIARAGAAAR